MKPKRSYEKEEKSNAVIEYIVNFTDHKNKSIKFTVYSEQILDKNDIDILINKWNSNYYYSNVVFEKVGYLKKTDNKYKLYFKK